MALALSPTLDPDVVPRLLETIGRVILGKPLQIRLAVACLLARGHLLIEDQPGVGKSTLAQTLAAVLGLQARRIQFTSDLLPGDLTGSMLPDPERSGLRFHPGPLFTPVVLADEINRASPRTQSALLEAMEDGRVSVDGVTHLLPRPFFVIATQNPAHQTGTFPLPESQLDRFLMRIELGYPDPAAERALLLGEDRRTLLATLPSCVDGPGLVRLQEGVARVHAAAPVLDYLQALVAASRVPGAFPSKLSPRAALAWLQAARAWAVTEGRDFVLPDDLQAVLAAVTAHRLDPASPAADGPRLAARLRQAVRVP
ncbi:MAG: MoxR family ATPase [Pseudomonadota bacterium]|nr:MoxR family ATPase [Pseudomonadota bacterium]